MEHRAAVAHNHRAWFFARAGRIVAAGGVRAALTPNDELTIPFPRGATGDALDRLLEIAREAKVGQASVWALTPDGPPGLGARLVARGFEFGWQAHWMHADLDARTDPPAPSEGISVGLEDRPEPAHGVPYGEPRYMSAVYALMAAQPRRAWQVVARDASGVVGQVVCFVAPGLPEVAGVYNMGVNPKLQRRGVGRALLHAAFDAARGLGCKSALLNSAASGFYYRVGFTHVGHGQTWWLQRKTLEAGPVPPERVAFVEAAGFGDVDALNRLPQPERLDGALALAVRLKRGASVRWLRERGAAFGVLDAWDMGWRAEARRLARDPALRDQRRGDWQTTPLHAAVERDDAALVEMLLAAGADREAKDTNFNGTPLGWARALGRTALATRLTE